MFRAMRNKLTLLYTFTFSCAVAVMMIALFFLLQHVMNKQQVEELDAYFVREQYAFLQQLASEKPLLHIDPTRHFFYYIYDDTGHFVHGDSQYIGLEKTINELEFTNKTMQKLTHNEAHLLVIKRPFMLDDRNIGYILIGKTITTQTNFFQHTLIVLLIVMTAFLIVIGAVSHFFARRAVLPIQQSYDQQKRFVADASHELRTPLAVFQSTMDILRTEPLSVFGKEVVQDAEEEVAHMEHLLEQLLSLARAEQLNHSYKLVHLSELLHDVANRFTPLTNGRITTNIASNVYVFGDDSHLKQLLYILVDNAMRYTTEGSITIATTSTGFTVHNSDSIIAAEDIPHIFERFYRGDSARVKGGTGLGLAIAKAITEQHGGTITVSSNSTGTQFTVALRVTLGTNLPMTK